MEKYYVSGCKDNGIETVTCDDNEAQFWTLYVRDDAGLSQGIIDLEFREDAETAMAVYVERDALQEQVRALTAERDGSLKAIADIYMAVIGGRPGWSNWHAYLDDIVEEVSTAIHEIRDQAVNGFSEFCGDNSVFIKETCNYDSLADAACIYLARIREGEQP